MSEFTESLRAYADHEQYPTFEQIAVKMNKTADLIEELEQERKEDCVEFFRWFWNAPGTNAEQGYDEWREALTSPSEDSGPAPATCAWEEVMEGEYTTWESACGQKFTFNSDGPADNDFTFCHGCGKRIECREDT